MAFQYHLWVALGTYERRVMVHADSMLAIDNVYYGVINDRDEKYSKATQKTKGEHQTCNLLLGGEGKGWKITTWQGFICKHY